MSIAITPALQRRAQQLSIPPALLKRAESISMAEPQDTGIAALAGGLLGPLGAGIYGGVKGESIGQGLRGAGSALVGGIGGALAGAAGGGLIGGLGTVGISTLLSALSGEKPHVNTIPPLAMGGGLVGAQLGSMLGGPLGGAYMAHRSAKKYNNKLDRYRKHQKDLAGGTNVHVYNSDSRREKPREEEEEKAARAPQNLNVATALGALSPLVSGVYAGAKGDSFGQGVRGTGAATVGSLLGALTAALGTAGVQHFTGGGNDPQDPAYVRKIQLAARVGAHGGSALGARNSANNYNNRLEEEENEGEKAAGWFSKFTDRAARPVATHNGARVFPRGTGGGSSSAGPVIDASPGAQGLWGRMKTPAIAGGIGLGLGETHGQIAGDIRGQHKGVAKATNYFENMPAWQHMLMGLSGLVGQQGALVDYGLGRAHKKQQQGGFWGRMVGPDYLDIQSRTRDLRKANPNPWQQRVASWFQ